MSDNNYEKDKVVQINLRMETSLGLWLAARFLQDETLTSELSYVMIEAGIELPSYNEDMLIEYYMPWLNAKGFITDDIDDAESVKPFLYLVSNNCH